MTRQYPLRPCLFLLVSLSLTSMLACAVDGQGTLPNERDDATQNAQVGTELLPDVKPVVGPIPFRATADRGNAQGAHGCLTDMGPYSHHEETTAAGESQLHIVSVYSSGEGVEYSVGYGYGDVDVHVTRPGTTTLVLASYAPTNWIVTATRGATIERVILSGYSKQTASVPPDTVVQEYSYESTDSVVGLGVEWPSYDSADLAVTAETLTGLPLTSFRGCFASESFQIDAPGELAPPHAETTATEPTALAGCEEITAESSYCMTTTGGQLAMIGLDSGATCRGPAASGLSYDNPSLAWIGDYVYTCLYDRGIARISVIDGSVDIAPVACGSVTSHGGGLAATAMFDRKGPPLSQLVGFGDFEAAARRDPGLTYRRVPQSDLIAAGDDRVFLASHTGGAVQVSGMASSGDDPFATLELEGHSGWISAMDVTAHDQLVIGGSAGHGLRIFDADTGALERVVNLAPDTGSLWGLDCVSR